MGSDPFQETIKVNLWEQVLAELRTWAAEVRACEDTPDLWKLRFDPEALEGAYHSRDNRPFTASEQGDISRQIRDIKASLKTNFELSTEQTMRVQERLDEAEEASRRMGRKDWILLFSGAVFSLILTDLITPDIAQHILTMTIHGLGHLGSGVPHIRGALHR